MSLNLFDLLGEHVLSGVDFDKTEVKTWGDQFEIAQCIRFTLDGVTYIAVEDPEDGYRSTMREIRISETPCRTVLFPVVPVLVIKKPDDTYGQKNETLQFLNKVNGKVVLEVGTDNREDYYPWYVAAFFPQNIPQS